MFTNFKIFSSGASPFYSFCRSGDHNFRHFAANGRLTQPSSASSLRSPALSRPSHSSSLRRGAFFLAAALRGKRPARMPARRVPQSIPETGIFTPSRVPHFHARAPRARSGDQHFYARARSGAPHSSPCRGTYLPKFGVSPPPPPRGGGGRSMTGDFISQNSQCSPWAYCPIILSDESLLLRQSSMKNTE